MKHRPNRTRRRERLKELSITKLIPNMLTTLALCAGLIAMQFALQQNWRAAVGAVAIAALLDSLDGGVARFLNAGTSFGAELDSLSDLVSFGVAPALVVFIWCMNDGGSIGSALVILYSVCCALRLARFNTHLEDSDLPAWASRFFTGVPSPAAAGMVLLPMMLSFELGGGVLSSVWLNGAVLLGVSLLMVGRLPAFSLKRVRIPHKLVLPVLLVVVLFAAFLVTRPWLMLALVVLAYVASLPFALLTYRRFQRKTARATDAPAAPTTVAGLAETVTEETDETV